MVAIVYPATLPCPQTASLQRPERRALSTLPGLRKSRPLWTDKAGTTYPVTFVFTSAAMVQVWLNWGASLLQNWGNWFAADWPLPEGGTGVFRFIGVPSYPEFLPSIGGWRVQASCMVRGRSTLPTAEDGLVDPMFADVLLLVNAEADLDDRSLYETPHVDEGAPVVSDGMVVTAGKRATYTGAQLEIVAEGITVEVFSGWDDLTVAPVTHSMWKVITGGLDDFTILAWIRNNGDWGPVATTFTAWQPPKSSGAYHHFYFFIPGGGIFADVELGADGVFLASGSIGFGGATFPNFDFLIGDYGNPSTGGSTWKIRGARITKGRRYPERTSYTVPAWPLPETGPT